jgi:hypothetical protein
METWGEGDEKRGKERGGKTVSAVCVEHLMCLGNPRKTTHLLHHHDHLLHLVVHLDLLVHLYHEDHHDHLLLLLVPSL